MKSLAKPIALQMWTVREEAQRDFSDALEKIARLGFAGVEQVNLLGYGGLSLAQVRTRMEDLELKTAGVHFTLDEWEADADGAIAVLKALGARYGAVSWIAPERRKDEAAYRQAAESIRNIAIKCDHNGLKLLYHHHDYEFVRFNGQIALDLIGEIVGPELLGVEVDVHWVKRSGEDPVAYLSKVGARCPLVHFKDLDPRYASVTDHTDGRAFTPVGTGCLDFPAIANAASHAEWYIVEQDYCEGDPFESVRISLENLKRMGLAAG